MKQPFDMEAWRDWFAKHHGEDAEVLAALLDLSTDERIEAMFYMLVNQGDFASRSARAAHDLGIAAFNASARS